MSPRTMYMVLVTQAAITIAICAPIPIIHSSTAVSAGQAPTPVTLEAIAITTTSDDNAAQLRPRTSLNGALFSTFDNLAGSNPSNVNTAARSAALAQILGVSRRRAEKVSLQEQARMTGSSKAELVHVNHGPDPHYYASFPNGDTFLIPAPSLRNRKLRIPKRDLSALDTDQKKAVRALDFQFMRKFDADYIEMQSRTRKIELAAHAALQSEGKGRKFFDLSKDERRKLLRDAEAELSAFSLEGTKQMDHAGPSIPSSDGVNRPTKKRKKQATTAQVSSAVPDLPHTSVQHAPLGAAPGRSSSNGATPPVSPVRFPQHSLQPLASQPVAPQHRPSQSSDFFDELEDLDSAEWINKW